MVIPRLSELLSELVWRVVGGTLPSEIAVKFLASEAPFENRIGSTDANAEANKEADAAGDGTAGDVNIAEVGGQSHVSPVVEALCDTLWGVDAMVSDFFVFFVRSCLSFQERITPWMLLKRT